MIKRTALAVTVALGLLASMLALGLGGAVASADTATTITGVVTDSVTSAPLGGIRVQGRWSGGVVKTVTTAPDGTFTVVGLTPGTPYTLAYTDPAPVPAYVPFTSSALLPGDTAAQALAPFTHISGAASADSVGLAGVQVIARTVGGSFVQRAVTGAGGTFDLDRIPGGASYRLDYSDTQAPARFAGVVVPGVPAGSTNVAQTLITQGHIAGVVTTNSIGLAGVRVQARKFDGTFVQQVTTGVGGAFDLDQIPLGSSYRLEFSDTQVPARVAGATAPSVAAGTLGYVQVLGGYGHISGTTLSSVFSVPMDNVRVQARKLDGTFVQQVTSGPTGSYDLDQIPLGGTYRLEYSDPQTPTRFATKVLTGIPADTADVNPTLIVHAHITGAVTSGLAGPGLAGVRVSALLPDNSAVASAVTAADGTFDISGLANATTYRLRYSDNTSPERFATVLGNQYPSGATNTYQAITLYAQISGTVRASTNSAPVAGVQVSALLLFDNTVVQTVTTDAAGAFTFDKVTAGTTYQLRYKDGQSPERFISGVGAIAQAPTTGITETLPMYGTISGRVRNGQTLANIAGIRVSAYSPFDTLEQSVVTGADGTFVLDKLPAGYPFVLRYTDTISPARFVTLTDNPVMSPSSGIVRSLVPYGVVSGTVRNGINSAPLSGVQVALLAGDNTVVQSVVTGAGGTFNLDQVPYFQTYRLRYTDTNVPARFAPYIPIGGVGPNQSGITQFLELFATTSGIAYNVANGSPVSGVQVSALAGDNSVVQSVVTGANGTFALDRLVSGAEYRLRFTDTISPARFAAVVGSFVPAGLSGVAQPLGLFATISGVAYNQVNGSPVSGVQVSALAADNSVVQSVVTGADGTFTLGQVLAQTSYRLRFTDTNGTARFATTVSAPLLSGSSGFAQPLAFYSGFQGTVRSFFGNTPLSGVQVSALAPDNTAVQSVITGADGTFTLNQVPTGTTYRLRFSDSTGANRFTTVVVSYPLGQDGIVQTVL